MTHTWCQPVFPSLGFLLKKKKENIGGTQKLLDFIQWQASQKAEEHLYQAMLYTVYINTQSLLQ
jgi:hypothetical protein